MAVEKLITDHIDTWTSALQTRSTAGRGSSGKINLYGIKKLRELILELAVRGKLVPQDPNDEPASELLKRIAAEKAELVKQGKIKKQKPLPEISEEEKPFELPEGWEWVRLGDLTSKITDGVHHTPKYIDSGVAFISVKDINGKNISFDDCKYISQEQHEEINQRCNPEKGDLLICRIGTLGRVTIVDTDRPFSLFVSVGLIKPLSSEIDINYLHKVFYSPCLLTQIENIKAGGSHTNKLNLNDIPSLLIPYPPKRERRLIINTIDKLMSLCDQLEQQSLTSLDAHQQLVETLLATLTDSQDAAELADNWARISKHFDTLFTTEASIDALKQTILQLAVMGKLVSQDPNDEPASELLKRIAQEKEQLVKDGKIKKQKLLPPISDDEKPFELPEGWEWCRMDDICVGITSGSTPSKEIFSSKEGIPYLKVYNIREQKIDFDYNPQFIQKQFHFEKMQRSALYPGDVIMNIVGPPLGKIAIIPESHPEWNCNQAIVFFRSLNKGFNKYLYTYLLSGIFLDFIELIGTAGQDNISVTKSRSIVVPIPPYEEQVKITQKIDNLLEMCSSLKKQFKMSQQTQLHLADALTDAAIN